MKTLRNFAALVFVAVAVSTGVAEEIDTAPAMVASEQWLAKVDAADYAQSWEAAATELRKLVAKSQWEFGLQAARGPMGVVQSRKVRTAAYTRSLPGAVDGEYVVIQYDTRFENHPLATEVVIPMREKDGSWKVSGYSVR